MSKVIVFYGSPRKQGITYELTEQVIAGAKSAGAEIVTYDLNDEEIKGCQGCYYCRANDGCATKDGLHSMYAEMDEATGIVAGFPIYFGNINAQSKKLVDRMFPMVNGDFTPRHPGKKIVTLYAQTNPDKDLCKNAIEANDVSFKSFGWELLDSILSYGAAAPSEIPQELIDRAFKAGQQLV